MKIYDTNDISILLDLVDFPDHACAINGEDGFAYYTGRDVDALLSSNARVIVCHSDLKAAIEKQQSGEKELILSDNPLLLFSLIAKRKYVGLMQPRGTWNCNPDGRQPSGTIIHPGAVIYDNVTLGDNCIIGANCVIGDAGFGFTRDKSGMLVSTPHFGGVRIGYNVEIGPGSVIDCGTFDDTIIEGNVRIDNMVQIAHNVMIDSGTRIMASVSISGGVHIGRDCWIAPKTMIRNGQTVGDNVLLGCSSMVTIDIPDKHRYQPRYSELHRCILDEDWDSE